MKPTTGLALATAIIATASFAQPVTEGGRTFTTDLSGANEVPPRDETASGEFTVTVNVRQRRLCYELELEGFDTSDPGDALLFAHIHEGSAAVNGPVRVHLTLPTLNSSGAGESAACVSVGEGVDAKTLAQIWARPGQYYVNVHTQRFPGGAIRGQLG